MFNLTPRQQEILDFIKNSLEVLGAPPTRAEISSAFGFASPNAAEDHLKALAKISRLLRDPAVVAKLRGTDDAEGLYAILTEPAANPKSASAA